MKNELVRKSIHLTMLVLPVGYLFLSKQVMLIILGLFIGIALFVEYARFYITEFSAWFHGFFGHLLRNHEKRGLTGSTYLLISCFLGILFFDKWIALLALLFMIISDAFGALFGRLFGKRYIFQNKSIEGGVVFILTGALMVFLVPGCIIWIGLAGILSAFIFEIFITTIDDNLTIPLGSGLIMQVLYWIFY